MPNNIKKDMNVRERMEGNLKKLESEIESRRARAAELLAGASMLENEEAAQRGILVRLDMSEAARLAAGEVRVLSDVDVEEIVASAPVAEMSANPNRLG